MLEERCGAGSSLPIYRVFICCTFVQLCLLNRRASHSNDSETCGGIEELRRSVKPLAYSIIGLLLLGVINSFIFMRADALQSVPTKVSTSGSIQYPTPGDANAWLHTQGTKILNGLNQEVIFNGFDTPSILSYWADGCTPWVTPSHVQYVRSKGFNEIRISLSMDSAVYKQQPGTPTKFNYYPTFWQTLDGLVNAAEQYGLWIIIQPGTGQPYWSPYFNNMDGNGMPSWMYDGSWSYQPTRYATSDYWKATHDFWDLSNPIQENVRTAFKTFWKDIALRYRDKANVMFDLMNEPLMDYEFSNTSEMLKFPAYYRTFMEDIIDEIRSVDYNNHIVGVHIAYFYDGNSHSELSEKVDRPNVVNDYHVYGWAFKTSTVPDAIRRFANYAWRYDQPAFFGEFGDVKEGLMTVSQVATFAQCSNTMTKDDGTSQPVGRSYYRYENPTDPASDIMTALTSNMYPGILYP